MIVAITGAEGVIGTVLRAGLGPPFQVRALTREWQPFTSHVIDVRDCSTLETGFAGAHAVVHLAAAARLDATWPEVLQSNIEGTRNVFEAARAAGVRRVVFASSGHVLGLAEERAGPELYDVDDQRVFDEDAPPEPDSFYAVSKVYGEMLGRLYASRHGLEVICVRFGTVLPDDNPCSEQPGRGKSASMTPEERYPRIRAKWLSHRDCCHLVTRCLLTDGIRYAIVFGTSNNPRQIWSLARARALLGYAPQDAAPRRAR